MALVHLADRAIIRAEGPDAESLLQNILTPDLAQLAEGEVRPGALLTPQGKILFDFVISRASPDAFLLDCRKDIAADFIRRLTFLRVRAKVNLSLSDEELVSAFWQSDSSTSDPDSTSVGIESASSESDSKKFADRRFPDEVSVFRVYSSSAGDEQNLAEWHRLRITHGVPESGMDYDLSDAFPHDILFDQNGGTGLRKGCYVGQEVVSRMHHRGTARRRLVIVEGASPLSSDEREITADGKPVGQLGTISGNRALAIVRVDRVAEAQASGIPVLAGGTELSFRLPAYAKFSLESAAGGADSH